MPRPINGTRAPKIVLCPDCEEPLSVEKNMLLQDPTCPHCGAFIDLSVFGAPTEAEYEAGQ
jgi:Zn finger protein HypA/HybF involved in hydrogenase expression